ncbi:MAG: outer membrane protein transport protein [Myxococcales bacterium]|nr:outer membrane protein transport protein [Myxococcales bacterium]
MTARALAAAALLALPAVAAADPLEQFGLGGAAAGQGGAVTATATGAAAAHHQPGGVALAKHPEVTIGWSAGWMGLALDGRDAGVEPVHGTSIGLAVPIPLTPELTLGVGLGLYLPDQYLARIRLAPITEPRFLLLDNDARVVVEPVAAVAHADKLAFGVGASLLADARSNKIVFDVGVVAGAKVGRAELDVELPPRVAPLVGLWLRPHPRVRAAVTYRGQLSLDLALDILANVEVAGVVTGDALVALRASDYFTPARITGAIAVDVLPAWTVDAELTWQQWSAFPAPPSLDVLVALDITPPLVSTATPAPDFTDTVSVRLGTEYRHQGARLDVAARAGAAFLPSPVPPQVGLTSYADGDRLQLAAGVGVTIRDGRPILTRPIDVDLGLQWQHLEDRLTQKQVDLFPGQAFSSGGDVVHATLTTTVRF